MRSDRDSRVISRAMKCLSVAITVSIVTALLAPAVAQTQDVLLRGRVQWLAAQKMLLLSDSGGLPVSVDLVRVPLEQYAALMQGNRVVVDGAVSNDGRRVIATSVMPATMIEEGR